MSKGKQIALLSAVLAMPILFGAGLFWLLRASADHNLEAWQKADFTTWQPLAEESHLNHGRAIYTQNCQSCHASDGVGKIGPALTDPKWRQKLGFTAMVEKIANGVERTPMRAWNRMMLPKEIHHVTSYVWSLSDDQGVSAPAGPSPSAPDRLHPIQQ